MAGYLKEFTLYHNPWKIKYQDSQRSTPLSNNFFSFAPSALPPWGGCIRLVTGGHLRSNSPDRFLPALMTNISNIGFFLHEVLRNQLFHVKNSRIGGKKNLIIKKTSDVPMNKENPNKGNSWKEYSYYEYAGRLVLIEGFPWILLTFTVLGPLRNRRFKSGLLNSR